MLVVHVVGQQKTRRPDVVPAEEPLEIRLDDHLVTTTMRTPGHDFELAVGFLHGEGLLGGASVQTVRYCATGSAVDTNFNVVTVETGGVAPVPKPRLTTTTSSCGWCGTEVIDDLLARLSPIAATGAAASADTAILAGLGDAIAPYQEVFAATGAVHAAASFDLTSGAIGVAREDVGRHNAVDKVVGRLLLDGALPAAASPGSSGLFVSGRASFEIVQKAWAAGFVLVAAVSGPTALAVEAARRANIGLVGFLRGNSMNIYVP